jgi:hypothetical protein
VLPAQSGESEEKALNLDGHDYRITPMQNHSLMARVRAVPNGSTLDCATTCRVAGGPATEAP